MEVDDLDKRFLTNTDETGRFIVKSLVTGKKYYVEPIGTPLIGAILTLLLRKWREIMVRNILAAYLRRNH